MPIQKIGEGWIGRLSPSALFILSSYRDAAADGAVQHLRRALDAFGGCVQRIRHRGLRLPCTIHRGDADAAEIVQFLLERADACAGVEQFVTDGERGHHREALVADLAELAAE